MDAGQVLGELAASLHRPSPEGWPRARKVQACRTTWGTHFQAAQDADFGGGTPRPGTMLAQEKVQESGKYFENFWTMLLVARGGEFLGDPTPRNRR